MSEWGEVVGRAEPDFYRGGVEMGDYLEIGDTGLRVEDERAS